MARKNRCGKLTAPERKVIEYFLSNDNKPSFKEEMVVNTGLNKALCRKICDELSDGILEKTYRVSRRSGYLHHYCISPDFSTFTCIAKDFLSSKDDFLFLESKYAKDVFAKHGYLKLFKKLGVEKRGYFDFDHGDSACKKIISEYGSIRKRLFTYILLYPDSAENISNFLHIPEKSLLQIPVILEDMRKEEVLSMDEEGYRINPEFLRETIKDYPEIYPFLKTRELDEALNIVQKKFGEYLIHKRDK